MLNVLQFIFSSFWIWLGSMMMIGALGFTIARIILAFKGVAISDD